MIGGTKFQDVPEYVSIFLVFRDKRELPKTRTYHLPQNEAVLQNYTNSWFSGHILSPLFLLFT